MACSWVLFFITSGLLLLTDVSRAQTSYYHDTATEYRCPQHWIRFQDSCYRFIKSPIREREEARKNCHAYQSDLVSINSLEEYNFIFQQLFSQDPQHRRWYTGVKLIGGYWSNEPDGSQLVNMDNAFLPEPTLTTEIGKEYLTYTFSNSLQRWGLEKVNGREKLLYICEAHITNLHNLADDDRTYTYGVEIDNPLQTPRGPYFIKQPVSKVFDSSSKKITNDISLSCLAGGYPTPTYEWFKEDFINDRKVANKIDPLTSNRYTISGGTLIIYEPEQVISTLLIKNPY